jgi:hypothetical protein
MTEKRGKAPAHAEHTSNPSVSNVETVTGGDHRVSGSTPPSSSASSSHRHRSMYVVLGVRPDTATSACPSTNPAAATVAGMMRPLHSTVTAVAEASPG